VPDAPPLWHEAAAFAQREHRHQTRRDGATPYAAHAARVALTVAAEFGCDDETTLAVAWLHDTIEDTTTDYEDLLRRFGRAVADDVAALSKNPALPSDERERRYDEGLEAGSWRAKLVKLADVLDNLRDSGGERSTGRLGRLIDRAERAIRIARAEGSGKPELGTACEIVASALEGFDAGAAPQA
jgi:(p)ppGpp synthase/HD superfamily hydrolase